MDMVRRVELAIRLKNRQAKLKVKLEELEKLKEEEKKILNTAGKFFTIICCIVFYSVVVEGGGVWGPQPTLLQFCMLAIFAIL